ncbi:MAG TPA: porin [Burkholderiales bacterium]|nr:porin [Burkholderiales bacterium]
MASVLAASVFVASPFAYAQGDVTQLKQQLEELDQKIRVIQRLQEIDKESVATKAKETPGVIFGSSGIGLRSGDGANELRLRGVLQADSRWYGDSQVGSTADTFLLRRVRPTFEGKFARIYGFRITPDFAGSATSIVDAYAEGNFADPFKVRVGRFKAPFGLERLQSGSNLAFNERAIPTNLAPNRDNGVQLFGDVLWGTTEYQIGAFNGAVDNTVGVTDNNNGKDFVGRVFSHPFKNTDWDLAKGFGIGLAYGQGTQRGTAAAGNLPTFLTPGQQTFASYATGAFADGDRERISPQFYYYYGPLGVLGEYVVSKQDVTLGAVTREVENDAWQVLLSWVVFGGDASFRGVAPKSSFDWSAGTWGAVELAARYSELDIDDDAFTAGLLSLNSSASKAKDSGVGVNWYLNRNVKLQLNYDETTFERGAAAGADRIDEKVLFTRVQLAY